MRLMPSARARRRALWVVAVLLLAAAALLWRGGRRPGTATAPAPAAAAASAPAPVLQLAASDVLTVRTVELTRTLAVSGSLRAVTSAVVKARAAGELLSLTVREGDPVRAGQLLGEIDPADHRSRLTQAEQQAASARARLEVAERTLANNQALVDQGFISRNALETSSSNAAGARADLQAAEAAVALARKALADARLVAPIGGIVAQRSMQPGERAALDARIVEIVDLSRLEMEASIAPQDVVALRVGQTASVQVDGLDQPLAARVERISPSTQAGTRAVTAYLALPGQPGLRQGLFARGSVALGRHQVLAVPISVVRVDTASPTVLVLADGRIEPRTVQTGARGQAVLEGSAAQVDAVEIRSGLAEGDVVVRPVVGAVRAGTPARHADAP